MVQITDKFTLQQGVTVCQDADIRGEITIGAHCVFHPRCTIIAMNAPIVFGQGCVIEENAIIVNRRKETLHIGEYNLFEVGCRIEAASIGSRNTFEPKSRVPSSIAIGDWCIVSAGCTLLPGPSLTSFEATESDAVEPEVEALPDHTVIYGSDCSRRIWSGEGSGQHKALHAKHLAYLREMLPRYNKLKAFAPGSATMAPT